MASEVLTFNNVHLSPPEGYDQGFDDLSFSVHQGEVLSILGFRRMHRRLLMDLASGLVSPDRGSVSLDDRTYATLRETARNRLRGTVGIVTDPPHFLNNVRLRENLRLPLRYHSNKTTREIDAILDGLFNELEVTPFRDAIPSAFDQRLLGVAALARALSVEPRVLILERPLECLGGRRAYRLASPIADHVTERGGGVLVLTTVPRVALNLSTRIVVFDENRIIAEGPPEAVKDQVNRRFTEWRDADESPNPDGL